jgi:hypothetical protein
MMDFHKINVFSSSKWYYSGENCVFENEFYISYNTLFESLVTTVEVKSRTMTTGRSGECMRCLW